MHAKKLTFPVLVLTILILSGCATILKGYKDTIHINTPDKVEIYDTDGEKLYVSQPVTKTEITSGNIITGNSGVRDTSYSYKTRTLSMAYIKLRSNPNHVLTVKTKKDSQKIVLYPKVGLGWVALDIVTGIVPLIIDLYTGNLKHFDTINIQTAGNGK